MFSTNAKEIVSFEIIVYAQSRYIVYCKGHTNIQVLQLLVCPLQTYNELYSGIIVMNTCVCLDE